MLRAWQSRLLITRDEFKKMIITQSQTVRLYPRKYIITGVGGGAGGAIALIASSSSPTTYKSHMSAQGGVGGTFRVGVTVRDTTDLIITMGTGGAYASPSAGPSQSSTPGGNTTVQGLSVGSLVAGGGTAASARVDISTSTAGSSIRVQYTGVVTPGTQGQNTIPGGVTIFADNQNTILSGKRSGQIQAGGIGAPQPVLNTNYPDDPNRGSGGDYGDSGQNLLPVSGGDGIVIIESWDD